MQRLAFDIETEPNRDRLAEIPEPEVATGNLKDPIKIAEKIAAAKAAQAERAALDPHFGRVVCISMARRHASSIETETLIRDDQGVMSADDAERLLLRWFWDQVRNHKAFATFNGAAFDVPFLLRRSMLLSVRPAAIDCGKYRVTDPAGEHLDAMRVLHGDDNSGCPLGYRRDLHFYAREILGEVPPYGDLDKGSIGDLYAAGQLDKIREVCSWDASVTLRLAEAVSHVYA